MAKELLEGEIIAIFHDHYTNSGDAVSTVVIENNGIRLLGKYNDLYAAHQLSAINSCPEYRARYMAKCKYHFKANQGLVVDLVKVVPR